MSGAEKLDAVQKSIESGDAKQADRVLSTITDPIDQKVFMSRLASRMQDSSGCSSLPDCQIEDRDQDGNVDLVKTAKVTVEATRTENGTTLHASANEEPGFFQRMKEKVSEAVDDLTGAAGKVAELPGAVTDLGRRTGDALNRAGTTDSEQNRRWNRLINEAEGKGAADGPREK